MSKTVGDHLCERLTAWGIKSVYGYPGDGINGIMGALNRHQDSPRFIQTRHEEMASFMACAHAKFTGQVGVCMATSGPGAIHLLNGLYDAKLDHQPVVAIVGQTYVRALGGAFQQEVKLLDLYGDVAGSFCEQVNEPAALRHCVDRAFRIAAAERTVTCLIIPADVQEREAVEVPPHATHTVHSGVGYWPPQVTPRPSDLEKAAEILNEGQRVAILVGQGALSARIEVLEAADKLGAGIAKALLGKGVIPDEVPFCTGSIGLLGTRPSWEMMTSCDTLLMIGSSFPYSEFLPKEGQARGVQIDIDARMLSIRYPMEMGLVGDSQLTLQQLVPLLHHKQDRSWQRGIEEGVRDWWRLMDDRAQPRIQHGRLRPQALFAELSRRVPGDAIVTSDSGSAANWFARHIRVRDGMQMSLSGNLATMVPGMPYAIAAKFAFPNRLAVATIGDGAMQMGGNAELLTAAEHYREWADPRMVVMVLNNQDLNQVTWEQRVMSGDPRFQASQRLPEFDYAAYARQIGLGGVRVESPEQIPTAWQQALAADRPFVIDAVTDPEEPPLPPHITLEEARKFMSSIQAAPGDGLAGAVNAVREKIDEFVPGR